MPLYTNPRIKNPTALNTVGGHTYPVVQIADSAGFITEGAGGGGGGGGSMPIPTHNSTQIAYIGATTRIDTVTYLLDNVPVAVLTLGYDGSDRLITTTLTQS